MRSSEPARFCGSRPVLCWLALLDLVGLAGCMLPSPHAAAVPGCAVLADAAKPQQAQASAWQLSVERGPLYAAATTTSPVVACDFRWEVDGQITLTYRLRDGGSLRALRNPAIEYTEQTARFSLPVADNPLALLARAERAAFGDSGCGINWQQADIQPADDERGVTETVYRGEACNCQARVRRDAAGRVRGLLLRSAC